MAGGSSGFGGSDGSDELVSGINVTPLVDVVLVLLVIFLMTAPVLYQSAIKIQLPAAKSGESADKSPLAFGLSAAGELLLNDKALAWDDLPKTLAGFGQKLTEQTATISADEKTPHGTVVKLMDLLRQAGLMRFALNVDASIARPTKK